MIFISSEVVLRTLPVLVKSCDIFLCVAATWIPALLNCSVFSTAWPVSLTYLLITVVNSSPFELTFLIVVIVPLKVFSTPLTSSVIWPKVLVVVVETSVNILDILTI